MKNIESTDEILQRIVPHILLNSSFVPDLGLFHGKMGIVLFFAHYARYTGNPIYDDFAGKLLDEIYEDITMDLPINLEYGLCGIGWGIEYLIQNKFMDGDANEILEEIDSRIMERDPRRIKDISLEKGLGGIAFYINTRLKSKSNTQENIFDTEFIRDLEKAVNKSKLNNQNIYSNVLNKNKNGLLKLLTLDLPILTNDITINPVGIYKGLSGIGLKCVRQ